MFEGFNGGILIGLAVMAVVIGVMLMRPPPAIHASFGGKRLGFSTKVPIAEAYRAVSNIGPGEKLSVARADEGIGRVILADGIGWTSWGFYYPVDFVKRSDGSTDVSVGIRSKAIQFGPLVTRAHQRTLETVRRLVEGRL
jgi:Flp pilus assembly protein CpaB